MCGMHGERYGAKDETFRLFIRTAMVGFRGGRISSKAGIKISMSAVIREKLAVSLAVSI